MTQKLYILSAGGTGGHLFPAQALANELKSRGALVHLATDDRATRYADKFPADKTHIISSGTFASKNPINMMRVLFSLFQGVRQSSRLFKYLKPDAVIGFGGYPTIPPLLAASLAGLPSAIHEQNAVMGRANKLLAGRVSAIAGGFLPETNSVYASKTLITGNPVRDKVIEASSIDYQMSENSDPFRLLVFGGSQGAQFFGRTIPEALGLLDEKMRNRIHLTLQARPEDVDAAELACQDIGIKAEISPFFQDMAQRIADAHLVISRSGASTVSELAAIGRPAILVPYPFALDHDQAENAKGMVEKGGAEIVYQEDLTAPILADMLETRISQPQLLKKMAENAKLAGKLNATILLADLVEAIGQGQSMEEFKDLHA